MPAPQFARLMSSQPTETKRRGSLADQTGDDVRAELIDAFKVGLRMQGLFFAAEFLKCDSAPIQTAADVWTVQNLKFS